MPPGPRPRSEPSREACCRRRSRCERSSAGRALRTRSRRRHGRLARGAGRLPRFRLWRSKKHPCWGHYVPRTYPLSGNSKYRLARMAQLTDVVSYLDELLAIGDFEDYGPNGLQVPGADEVSLVVTGVSSNLELFEGQAGWGPSSAGRTPACSGTSTPGR